MDVKNWSARDSVKIVESLTFPTVSVDIMSIAREILESLRERKEIQRFDWNERMCRKLQCFCTPPGFGVGWGEKCVSSSCKCLVAEKLPEKKGLRIVF